MRRLVAGLLLLAACSSGGGTTATTVGSPQCSALFAEGATLTQAQFDGGCLDGPAPTQLSAVTCTDGRLLASFLDAWAFVGGEVHVATGELAADPGYAEAYAACA